MFSKKNNVSSQEVEKGKVVTIFRAAGGSSVPLLNKLVTALRKRNETTIVVEFPCLGIPQVAYNIGITEIEPEHTIDQLLIDYDRGMLKGIDTYIRQYPLFDGILIQPRARPDMPTLLKLQSEKTLFELPTYLKNQLNEYDNIVFVVQGQLIHSMTFFAVRDADHIILSMQESEEVIRTYATYKTLHEDYAISTNRMTLFSETKLNFAEAPIVSKVNDLPSLWKRQESFYLERKELAYE